MKLKEILVLLVIIMAGIIFYHAQTGNLDLYIELGDDFFDRYDVFRFDQDQTLPPPFPHRMEIVHQHGQITVYPTEGEEITIYTQKKVRHNTEQEARKIADEFEFLVSQDSEKVIVSSTRNHGLSSRLSADLEIYIPEDSSLKINNSYGRVEIRGIKSTEIINKNGEIHASDIRENLKILASYQPVYVENIGGICQIETVRSRIKAVNIKGQTIIKNKYGSIDLEDLSQDVFINGLHCQINGEDISGSIEAETSYEPVELNNISTAKIRADNSPIRIFRAQNNVEIKNKYDRIQLQDIYGNLDIEGESLEIIGRNLFGDSISIISSYRNIDLERFSSETEISFSHGKIILNPLTEEIKPIVVKGKYAEIDFMIPPGLKIPIQAQTKSGQIKWGLSQKGVEQISNGYSIIKAFLEKDEQPLVWLLTTYSTISVRESS